MVQVTHSSHYLNMQSCHLRGNHSIDYISRFDILDHRKQKIGLTIVGLSTKIACAYELRQNTIQEICILRCKSSSKPVFEVGVSRIGLGDFCFLEASGRLRQKGRERVINLLSGVLDFSSASSFLDLVSELFPAAGAAGFCSTN